MWNQFSSYPIAWALGLELRSPHLCNWCLDLVSHSLSPGFSVPVFMDHLEPLANKQMLGVELFFFFSCGVSDSRYQGLPRTLVVISELRVGAGMVLYGLPHGQGLFWKSFKPEVQQRRGEKAETSDKSGFISSCSQTSALSSIYTIPK